MQSVEGDFQKRAPLVFIDQVDKSGEGVLHLLGIAQAPAMNTRALCRIRVAGSGSSMICAGGASLGVCR